MKMLKNKSKLTYRFIDDSRNTKDIAESLIKDILVKASPRSSCWWSKMKTRSDGLKNQLESIKHNQVRHLATGEDVFTDSGSTAKTCPGILGLFNQAYLVKCPTDCVITIDKDCNLYYNVCDGTILSISIHNNSQFYQDDNKFFEGKMAVKFDIKLNIKTTGFGYMLVDPMYHSNSEISVGMGYLDGKYSNNQQLNIIGFIDLPKGDETKTVIINQGDIIAYLIPFEKCSLSFSEENFIAKRLSKTFNQKRWFHE